MRPHTPPKPITFQTVEARSLPDPQGFFTTRKVAIKEPITSVSLELKVGRKRARIMVYPTAKGFQISPALGGQLAVSRCRPDESALLVEVYKRVVIKAGKKPIQANFNNHGMPPGMG